MRSFQFKIAIGFLLLSTISGFSTEHNHQANIAIDCNEHGAVLNLENGGKIYLGKKCDAYQPEVGSGRWWFAASAFLVEINGQATRYANELDCDVPYCRHS